MRRLVGVVITLLIALAAVWLVFELAEVAVGGSVFLIALAIIGAIALLTALVSRRPVV